MKDLKERLTARVETYAQQWAEPLPATLTVSTEPPLINPDGPAAVEAITQLEAEIAAQAWQPIESAPKDQWILAWDEDGGHALLKFNPIFAMAGEDADGWMGSTHWRPLPAPPLLDQPK